jgi:hypothetical protein
MFLAAVKASAGRWIAPLTLGPAGDLEASEACEGDVFASADGGDDRGKRAVENLLGVLLGNTMLGGDALDQIGGVHIVLPFV